MNRQRRREVTLLGLLGLVVATGLGLDAWGTDVATPRGSEVAARVVERTAFCPPAADVKGGSTTLSAASASGDEGLVTVAPALGEPRRLEAGATLTKRVKGPIPVDVSTYRGVPAASVVASYSEPSGAGATRCPPFAATRWYFPEGSSALGVDERLILYNPFPDEAVVRVTFITPAGPQPSANLADVAVPAGGSEEIKIKRFVRIEKLVSTRLVATRGRVVAWRTILSEGEAGAKGVQLSLGTTAPALNWYFAHGAVGEGVEQTFTLVNPNHEEATVAISLVGDKRVMPLPELGEISVPRESSKTVSLARTERGKGDLAGASAVVTSINGVAIVAERSLEYSGGDLEGLASEIGSTQLATRWTLGPVVPGATTDSVAVFNPEPTRATVDLAIATADGLRRPAKLTGLRIRGGLRIGVNVAPWTQGRPAAVVVSSDAPVVAERFGYSPATSDVADALGVPLRRS